MTRARGFTLIELMIALALAGLVVGGAMQLHASFNRQAMRQNEIADMQQTLRVSMQILQRAVRLAGAGISGGSLVEPASGSGCNGPPLTHYAFQWSNNNTYTDPPTYTTSGTPGNDVDPDWFQVMYADITPGVFGVGDSGANLQIYNAPGNNTPDLSDYNPGDLFTIVFPAGDKSCVVGGKSGQDCSLLGACVREISAGAAHGGSGGTKFLQHNPAQSNRCFNPTPSQDDCTASLSSTNKAVIRHISGQQTTYRVMTPTDPLNVGGSPKLTMRTAPMGTAYATDPPPWVVIAENIEDMQLALVMRDGRVCNVVDDPTQCNPSQAVAVRITLVARSSSPVPGMTMGEPGQYEDEAAPATHDGYLRRALTAEIELRNMGNP